MTDWLKTISKNHNRVHRDIGDKLHIQAGASKSAIKTLEKSLKLNLVEEFRSLYEQCNGFGLTCDDEPDRIWWFFRPLEQIEEFADGTRSWFAETHPELAARFFPFIDWGNGDGMGYLIGDDDATQPGLYCFEHENYGFDEDDDPEEFIIKWNNSIYELLTVGAGI